MSVVYKCSRRRERYLAFYLTCFTTLNQLVTRYASQRCLSFNAQLIIYGEGDLWQDLTRGGILCQLQDLVGLVISMLLLGDFSLVLLTLLQMFSFSLADVFLVLFILPLSILLPFPAGINALFSQGPRRSAGLARVYAMWNITSLVNVVSTSHIHFHYLNFSLL